MAKPKPKLKPPLKRKRRLRLLRWSHPVHGSLEVRMRGEEEERTGHFTLRLAADAAEGDGLRWVQVARVGEFRGHPAGPFALTPTIFDEMVRNYVDIDRKEVAFDFEHASEVEPNEGAIPTEGAPAQGWIRQLENRGAAGLWGLVEWLEPARTYIRQKKYKYLSPAIRFNAKHPESGKPIGARLTSVALTNRPFLRGMVPLMATDKDGPEGQGEGVVLLGGMAYSTHEYMPRLRACLKLAELATAAECAEQLDRVEAMLAAAGGNHAAMVQGVELGSYLQPLRAMVQAPLHHTWEQVFEAVRALIAAAIEEHEALYHPDGDDDDDDDDEETPMKDPKDEAATATKLRDLEGKNAEMLAKQTEMGLTLKERDARIAELEKEVAERKEAEGKRLSADRDREVRETIAAYGKTKGLKDTDKPDLLALLTASPEAFRRLYPPVDPQKRVLMAEISSTRGTESLPAPLEGSSQKISLRDAAKQLAAKENISLGEAQRRLSAAAARQKG